MGEKARIGRIYRRYRGSPRKRRAWAADNPGNLAIREELLARIVAAAGPELDGSGAILDLGCGGGWLLRALADRGVEPGRLHGVELQPTRAAAARGAVPGATIAIADARHTGLPTGGFDLVLMMTLLSSMPSAAAIRAGLAEAGRVLAPGGLLLCYEPRIANPLNRHTRLLRDRDLDAAGLIPRQEATLTVLPWLARRLGRGTASRYARLGRVAPLRTHRLIAHREYARPGAGDE